MTTPSLPTPRKAWLSRSYSSSWLTTLTVAFIVIISVSLSIWFFWRSLYLPELKTHARYLTSELELINSVKKDWRDNPEIRQWVYQHSHVVVVENPGDFPLVADKAFVGIFTDVLQHEIGAQLGRPVEVYFKFKPTPQLWVQDSRDSSFWIREPVVYYSQYSPTLLILFLIGLPILTLLTIILLARQLNRPLRYLQRAATNYIRLGHATTLPTREGPTEIRQVNMAFNHLFTTLNQAQKERTIMLAGISHDLRTPLTRMRLTAEMLPDDFFREGLIYDIEDMDAILEQFISFMKDGSDEPVRLTDLDVIFNEIMVQFAPMKFIYQSEHNEAVPVRPLSIKRLVINLVNNANRYGKPPIYLSATVIPTFIETAEPEDSDVVTENEVNKEAQEQLMICVRDCGDGVAEDQLERIMQPFERGETARTTQGSGLGLAIVSRIARLHHGTVEAINHPDGGLQVCVRIPLISKVSETETLSAEAKDLSIAKNTIDDEDS
ncbi:two-component system osmolarity sensor histidine kinase EnvZ [Psychrobacter sp. PL15]|jgi:two-component system osmolarity sensor histidine kinase EnvZ|uniref:ATP-binding protein n=1 Tax=unclassified Psychrobacter TaxID=196806 RepID=UPI001AE6B464|nr:ATP-binding protein [Psychrobacter sp. PL15]MEC5210641.1 two-component system osmolarity sensor histidine kinase EnvZ [Psychrobacter sp. PL15]